VSNSSQRLVLQIQSPELFFIYCSSAVIQHGESGFDDSMRVLLYMRVAEAVVGKAFAAAKVQHFMHSVPVAQPCCLMHFAL
jgi:hypothetical protein